MIEKAQKPDESRGVDPVPVEYDIRKNVVVTCVDGRLYEFDVNHLPFTVVDAVWHGWHCPCVDRELILKHAGSCYGQK